MKTASFLRATLLCVVSLPSLLFAQASTPTTPAANDSAAPVDDEVLRLNQFVVTGSVTPHSVLDSALAITTLSSTQIEQMAPRSVAELIKAIPGFYVESTGGESNNNLYPRGIHPQGGFRYVALQEDGLQVISEGDMSFSQADNYIRPSTWIANVEGLRGGTSGVFVSNAPIGTVNFISREGTQQFAGENKIEFGDYGLIRDDLWVAGPIDKNTTYALGGFYRLDQGIRGPGFTADRGGQIAANVRHTFANDKGYIKFLAKAMDDRVQFMLPIALQGDTSDPKTIPGGPDINDGATASPDIRKFNFPNTPAGPLSWDLADGIQVKLSYLGTEIEYQLAEGLKFQNRNRYTHVDKSWNANPFGSPMPLQAIADSLATSANTTAGQYAAALDPLTNHYRYRLTYPGQGNAVAAANAAAAAKLNGNGLGNLDGYWHSAAVISNFQDDLRLIKSLNDDKTTITAGLYYSWLKEDRLWQWNQMLIDESTSYHRLDLTYLDASGNPVGSQYTYNGFTQVGSLYLNASSELRDISSYVNVEHKIGNLSLDAGLRFQNQFMTGSAEQRKNYDLNTALGAGNNYPALKNAQFGNGQIINGNTTDHEKAYTVGANYTFNNHMAAFVRYSNTPRLANDDAVLNGLTFNGFSTSSTLLGPIERIRQYEGGIKFATANIGVSLTAFFMQQRNLAQTGFVFVNGLPTQQTVSLGSDAPGLELETVWSPIHGLSVNLRGVVQRPRVVTSVSVLNTDGTYIPLDGKRDDRVPNAYGSLNVGYTFPTTSWGRFQIDGTASYTGKRYQDDANTVTLPAFQEYAAGASLTTKNAFVIRVQASNLFNGTGLTEGDPRGGIVSQGGTGVYFNARPLLPRSIIGSVTYKF